MPQDEEQSRREHDGTPRFGSIWYATKADPLLALEPVLWVRSPDGEVTVLEPVGKSGSAPPSVVQAVLGAAGFLTPPKHAMTVKSHDESLEIVKHFLTAHEAFPSVVAHPPHRTAFASTHDVTVA